VAPCQSPASRSGENPPRRPRPSTTRAAVRRVLDWRRRRPEPCGRPFAVPPGVLPGTHRPPPPGSPMVLEQRLARRTARPAVIGLGYVGLPLAIESRKPGSPSTDRCRREEGGLPQARALLRRRRVLEGRRRDGQGGRFIRRPTSGSWPRPDTINICVPTPLTRRRTPTSRTSVPAAEHVARHLKKGQLVILESTTYPGRRRADPAPAHREGRQGRQGLLPRLLARARRPGNPTFQTRNIPKVVGGVNPALHRRRLRALTARPGDGRPRLGNPRAECEAAREHVPQRQHRLGQRDRPPVRAPGIDVWESSTPRRRSRSASCPSTRDRASAGTASRSIRSTCRGRQALGLRGAVHRAGGQINGHMPSTSSAGSWRR